MLQDAGEWKDEYTPVIHKIYSKCKESEECMFKRNIVRPCVAMSLGKDFNDVVAMDLKKWGDLWILYVIDTWSRYTVGTFITRKLPLQTPKPKIKEGVLLSTFWIK